MQDYQTFDHLFLQGGDIVRPWVQDEINSHVIQNTTPVIRMCELSSDPGGVRDPSRLPLCVTKKKGEPKSTPNHHHSLTHLYHSR